MGSLNVLKFSIEVTVCIAFGWSLFGLQVCLSRKKPMSSVNSLLEMLIQANPKFVSHGSILRL